VHNATFNINSGISRRRSVLLLEEIGCCIEYTSSSTGFEITTLLAVGIDCTGNCKSNYHMITTSAAPIHVYTDSTCKCKFDYLHILTIVNMTVTFLLDDTTSHRQWLYYTRYVILYLKL
jgi:hypothetical protein